MLERDRPGRTEYGTASLLVPPGNLVNLARFHVKQLTLTDLRLLGWKLGSRLLRAF